MSVEVSENKAEGFLVRSGQTVICFGDSITQNSVGYCSMIAALIAASFPERQIRVINAGVGGNKITDLLGRVDRDVLSHRPDWVTVSIGINDVWHGLANGGEGGVPLHTYRAGLERLTERIAQSGASLILLPPTVIGENPDSDGNRALAAYRAAVRAVGAQRNYLVAPTDIDLDIALRSGVGSSCGDPGKTLTTDGVHMRPPGDAVLAVAVLKTLGFFADPTGTDKDQIG